MTEECKLCAGEEVVEDLNDMCAECRSEVLFLLAERRAGEY